MTGMVSRRPPANAATNNATTLDASAVRHESYFTQSRRPLAALVFLTPMVLLYEVGTLLFHVDRAANAETRIVAFTWVRSLFDTFGASGALVAPLATVAMLLGWHVFARQPWRLRPTVPAAMAAESCLLAIPLLMTAALAAVAIRSLNRAELGSVLLLSGDLNFQTATAMAVLGLGAGIYEELIFRLIGFALLHTLLRDVLGVGERMTLWVTLGITSLAFAGYHHLPGTGEVFALGSFTFRTVAGVWLGLVFAARGLGLAAGSHAAYDVLLSLLPLLTAPSAATP